MLNNLGLHDWVAHNFDEYVDVAVRKARDIDALAAFRKQARDLYKHTALGNGKLFARDFEEACLRLLEMPLGMYQHQVPALSGDEMVRRAIKVMGSGNFEAAERIISYCLKEYPSHGHAQVIWTHRLTSCGKFAEAVEHLEGVLARTEPEHYFILLLNLVRFNILSENFQQAAICAEKMQALDLHSDKEKAYQRLCKVSMDALSDDPLMPSKESNKQWAFDAISSFCVIIVGRDESRNIKVEREIQQIAQQYVGLSVVFSSCDDSAKCLSYKKIFQSNDVDAFVVVDQSMVVFGVDFFESVATYLASHDAVGFGGVKKWDRLDWYNAPNGNKAISHVSPSGEKLGFYEINHFGLVFDRVVSGMSLLDGRLFAMRASAIRALNLNTALDSMLERGGSVLEEYFTYEMFCAGMSLAVHLNLGVMVDWAHRVQAERVQDARLYLMEKMEFDPFMEEGEERTGLSISVPTQQLALDVMNRFLT